MTSSPSRPDGWRRGWGGTWRPPLRVSVAQRRRCRARGLHANETLLRFQTGRFSSRRRWWRAGRGGCPVGRTRGRHCRGAGVALTSTPGGLHMRSHASQDPIFATVMAIPRGRVATYAQVACAAGLPPAIWRTTDGRAMCPRGHIATPAIPQQRRLPHLGLASRVVAATRATRATRGAAGIRGPGERGRKPGDSTAARWYGTVLMAGQKHAQIAQISHETSPS